MLDLSPLTEEEFPSAPWPVTEVTEVTDFQEKERATFSELLDEVQHYLERFIAYPSPESATAHALWIAHAHLVGAFENTPRLAFLSPEPGSGKSRCMELTEALVPRPVLSVNASVAYIFRKISDEAGLPTLLLDEIDAVFSNGKAEGNEDLRGLLNSGYRKGATAGRAAIRGKEIVTEEWPSFCAVALAGLNQLPDTLMTRSIVINMKRRPHGQKVESYRRRVNAPEAAALAERLAWFADSVSADVSEAWPELPEGIEDRDADIWEPILAIADAAGGHWPDTSRAAAVVMVARAKEKPATLGIRLLDDIRAAMAGADRVSTNDLLDALHEIETAPWSNIKGEPIDSRFLAKMLNKYEISTNNTVKIDGRSAKGYLRSHFADAWSRYLPTVTEVTEVTDFDDKAGAELGQGYRSDEIPMGVGQVILNNTPTNENRGVEIGSPLHSPQVGNSGNHGNPATCRACRLPLHPALAHAGIHPTC
ncbi:DUF3631 domain-containing protein [Pseudarthrobacter sp. P1]|uniref:DUF3631 domain-containing protein n=1 Tax=Pseudarthrobacter sp. P1 TaxID=3418418 RepID=UPI003CEFEE76